MARKQRLSGLKGSKRESDALYKHLTRRGVVLFFAFLFGFVAGVLATLFYLRFEVLDEEQKAGVRPDQGAVDTVAEYGVDRDTLPELAGDRVTGDREMLDSSYTIDMPELDTIPSLGGQQPDAGMSPQYPSAGGGALLIPVAGIRKSELIDTYTQARSENRTHNAIDIIAPEGRPVLAATNGVILKLFESERGGITIYQLGSDGKTVYYYAHLQRYAPGLEEGKQVRRGEEIGFVGDTGNAGEGNYHLHFAIWLPPDPQRSFWDGEPINPYPLLVR